MLPHRTSVHDRRRAIITVAMLVACAMVTPSRGLVDTDRNGISDVWASLYPTAGGPTADPDGDGANNLAESLAGTNPVDPADRLTASIAVDPGTSYSTFNRGDLVAHWRGVVGKRYRLQSSTNLTSWGTVNQLVCTEPDCAVTVRFTTTTDTATARYWRVQAFDHDANADGITDWEELNRVPATDPYAGARTTLACPLLPFALCFANSHWTIPPAEQIALSQTAGYAGLALSSYDVSATRLEQFADHPDVQAGRFRIPALLWWVDSNPLTADFITKILDPILDQLVRMDCALWVVIAGTHDAAGRAAALAKLHTIADRCAAKNGRLVLYPHAGTTFVCTSEALSLYRDLASLGHPEVRLSIHLCHEQAAGKMAQIATTVADAAPYLAIASINGSNNGGDIKPLDQGTYDPTPFLQALAAVGFSGPMTLHTYNLRDPRLDNHLVRSRLRWEQLVAPPVR